MIFETIERDVVTGGAISSKDITLSANAKAFKIIFGQIYPDIIKAIVRELFANGWDSQKVAGNLDTPIDIHLPTTFEPYFSIRDYGVGMTPSIVEGIYSNVFESTKDGNNEEAGMFGMGSKTPLGYTDTFAVTSYVDGIFWAYSIYIASNGCPKLDLVATGETTEPNGVYVQLSVKSDDFETFKSYAERFALNSGTAVNINRKRVINHRAATMQGENWSLLERSNNIESAMIQMGCILYKLDVNLLINNLSLGYSESSDFRRLVGHPIIVQFPIGTFDVTGSREDIIYNNESSQILYDAFTKVKSEMTSMFRSDMQNAESLTKALYLYDTFIRYRLNDGYQSAYKWKSWKLTKIDKYIALTRIPMRLNPYSTRGESKILRSFGCSDDINTTELYNRNKITYVVIDDGNTNRIWNRLYNLDQHLRNAGLSLHAHNRNDSINGYNILYVDGKNNRNLSRLVTILPENYIAINISNIEPIKIVRTPRTNNPEANKACFFVSNGDKTVRISSYKEEIDEEVQGYFVRVDRKHFTDEVKTKVYEDSVIAKTPLDNVYVIGKTNEHLIQEFDLEDLFAVADGVRNSIRYSDSNIFYHVVVNILKTYHQFRWYSYGLKKHLGLIGSKLDIEYDENEERGEIIVDINPTMADRVKQIENSVIQWLQGVMDRNPILKYVDNSHIMYNLIEILTIQGEI